VKDDAGDAYYFGSRRLFLWIVPKRK
jgi:hypothetical protein